jgi:hypothetical protein
MTEAGLILSESDLMRSIMIALSADGHAVFRANVGLFFTKDGRPARTGLPVGFSDLFGARVGDARAFFLEVKRPGGSATAQQSAFLGAMQRRGAITGIVRSVDDARSLLAGHVLRNSHQQR